MKTMSLLFLMFFLFQSTPTFSMNEEEAFFFRPKFSMHEEEEKTSLAKNQKNQKDAGRIKIAANHKKNKVSAPLATKDEKKESQRLLKNIKHVEPGCCQYVQRISHNPRWQAYKLDVPFYDMSAYTSGCGTFRSILWRSILCCMAPDDGGCFFFDDDLVCFGDYDDDDQDGEGKVMTRREALPIMEAVNREKLEYYRTHPENREESFHYDGSYGGTFLHYYSRNKEVKEYERNLRAQGMEFIAHDLN